MVPGVPLTFESCRLSRHLGGVTSLPSSASVADEAVGKRGKKTETQNIVASVRCFTNICGPFNTRALCYPDFFFPKAYSSP